LFVLAAAYLAVAATLIPSLWRERARFTVADLAFALMFPCIGIPAAIFGASVLATQKALAGHVYSSFAATVVALVPALLFLARSRDRSLLVMSEPRAREAEKVVSVRARELQALAAISNALARANETEEVGRILLDEVTAVLRVDFAALALVDEERREATGLLARADARDVEWWRDVRLDLEREPSGIASAYFDAAPVTVYDVNASPLVSPRLVNATGAKSGAFIPLIVEERVVGVVVAATTRDKRAFSREDVTVMQALAAEAALAVDRTRAAAARDAALRENQHRLAQQTALLQAAQVVTSELQLEAVLQRLVDEVARLLVCEAADCYLLDAERGMLRCAAVHGLDSELLGFEFPADRGLAGEAIAHRRPALSTDYAELPAAVPHGAYEGFAGAIVAPMSWSGDIRGVLGVGTRDSTRAFSKHDGDLLEAFATLAALALRNAESFEERSRQARFQRAFYRIASALAAPISYEETLRAVAQAASDALGGASAALLMPAGPSFSLAAAHELPPELAQFLEREPASEWEPLPSCARARRVVAAPSLADDDRFEEAWKRVAHRSGYGALLAVPVEAPPREEGGLAVVFFTSPRRFNDDDLELAQNLARAARGALERSELFESERRARDLAQQLARSNALLARELDPAAVLDEVVAQAPALLGADAAAVRLLEGDELVVAAARGPHAEGVLQGRSPSTGRLAGDVVHSRAPVAIPDVGADERLRHADPILARGYGAYLAVPLVGADNILYGVLCVYSQSPRPWREEEIEALAALAATAVAARSSAELYQRVALEKERSGAILANIADGIVAVDREGKVVLWNAAAEQITGVPAGAALSRSPAQVLQRNLESGADTDLGDRLVSIRRGTDEVWLSLTEAVMRDPAGAVAGRIFAFRDISAERVVEQMKSDFVSYVSHELRTPLTSIYGFAETLLRQDVLFGEEERETFLAYIASESERLTRIVDTLLTVARLDAGDLQVHLAPTDVRAVVSEVIENAQQTLGVNGHRFVVDAPPERLDAETDRDKLRQILSNLVENAVKYSPEGGTVTVKVARKNERVEVRVVDEGVGIPEAEQRRIFTKFYRGDAAGRDSGVGGTGLGLFIAHELVSAMGGRMWVDSSEGVGSSFAFELPLARARAIAAAE
jgi:PAS domain S-box-containing protein